MTRNAQLPGEMMEEFEGPSQDALTGVTDLANRMIALQEEVLTADTNLQLVKETLRQVSEELLPTAMADAGLRKFDLVDGSSVKINEIVGGSISREKLTPQQYEEALTCLEQLGGGSLIKNTIIIEFPKGHEKECSALVEKLATLKSAPKITVTRGVHFQTLGSWVRERITELSGEARQKLNVFQKQQAVIKRPAKS